MIENVGPIERLSIPLPDAGVVVLHGRNGAGKSHALAAVDSLVGGRGRPPCRDGAAKGIIEGVGARLTIGRSSRRTGEAEIMTLEGKLDISQLVAPPIKDEESADRTRIKALIQLSGAIADPNIFSSILPHGIDIGELVPPSDGKEDDPVALAAKIKRALEAEARRHETMAEDAAVKAQAFAQQAEPAGGESIASSMTREQAEAALQEALVALHSLEAKAEESEQRRARIEKARHSLDDLRAQIPADQSIEGLEAEQASLNEKIQRLQKALAVAQERRQQIRRQLDHARTIDSQIKELEKIISEIPEAIQQEKIEQARREVESAREQHRLAILVERQRGIQAQADEQRKIAALQREYAERLRDAARATDDILSEYVCRVTRKLRVDGGRLVCDTERGAEPYAELSPGERWRIALEIAVEQVGRGGLVTIPQEAWESLDPVNRREVSEIAHSVGVVVLTAEADQCDEIETEII